MNIIQGGVEKDHRGQIRFVNDFDMTEIKRFYIITNVNVELVRGWRAHRIEQRWFYALKGSFFVDIVQISDWENVDSKSIVERRILKSDSMELLHLPPGYGTAFQAIEEESELLVFADYPISHAKYDDYTWAEHYFVNRDKQIFSLDQ